VTHGPGVVNAVWTVEDGEEERRGAATFGCVEQGWTTVNYPHAYSRLVASVTVRGAPPSNTSRWAQ